MEQQDITAAPATPTLPDSWSPTVAGCLSTEDFWQWDYGSSGDSRVVLGGPSQLTNCLPTAWSSDAVYLGSGCPPYYTSACQGDDSFSTVTCCPSLYLFECKIPILAENHGSQFRCWSAWTSSGAIPVTHTNFVVNNLAVETQVAQTLLHLHALAIMYITSTSEPSATSTTGSNDLTGSAQTEIASSSSSRTTQSASESSSSNTGISSGASVGIGVGAAAGAVLLAVVAWWAYRRRRSRRGASKLKSDHPPHALEIAEQETPNNGHKYPEAVPSTRSELLGSSPAAQELPASPQ